MLYTYDLYVIILTKEVHGYKLISCHSTRSNQNQVKYLLTEKLQKIIWKFYILRVCVRIAHDCTFSLRTKKTREWCGLASTAPAASTWPLCVPIILPTTCWETPTVHKLRPSWELVEITGVPSGPLPGVAFSLCDYKQSSVEDLYGYLQFHCLNHIYLRYDNSCLF